MNDSDADSGDPYAGINPSQGYYVFQAIFLTLVTGITVFGNVAVCYVVYRTQSITTVTGMCITSLAIADLLRGGLILPVVVVASAANGSWQINGVACSLLGMGYTLFGSASVMTLAAVSVDRYFAILKPLQYTNIVTTWRAAIFLCLIWMMSFLMALLPIFGWSEYIFLPWNAVCISNWHNYKSYAYFYLTVSFFIPFSILIFCYYKIFVVARHQSRRVMSLEMASAQVFPKNGGVKPKNKQRLVMRKEKKAAMTLFAVMGVFILCVTPYCFVHLAFAYLGTQNLLISLGITSMLSFINSAANPLIYGILNRKFRRVFVEVIKCHHCPWQNGFLPNSSSVEYASDAYTGASASTKRRPILPRDSGYMTSATTQTTSSKTQDVFSISVAAATANTMAALGTNLTDLTRLTAGIAQLSVIEDLPSLDSIAYTNKGKQATLSRPAKGVFFNIEEVDSAHDKNTEPQSDNSDSAGNENLISEKPLS